MSPQVSFVVPCYRLAHLLQQCVDSILSQSYGDFEVLIMDDCSPDDTAAVARSITDPRVRHVRQRENVGHLRNYNAGIRMARGKYIWLVSADDYLIASGALERYVRVLDAHPSVGFVFSPAIKLDSAGTQRVAASHGPSDWIRPGHDFLPILLRANCVPASGALARKACYIDAGCFPLDLPHAGDWYLWCRFALSADVAYVAEPAVVYRQHDNNMSKDFERRRVPLVADELAVRWRMERLFDEAGLQGLSRECRTQQTYDCAKRLVQTGDGGWPVRMTLAELERLLQRYCASAADRVRTRAAVFAAAGDACYDASDAEAGRLWYGAALRCAPWMPRTILKYLLVRCGSTGTVLRRWITTTRTPSAVNGRDDLPRVLATGISNRH